MLGKRNREIISFILNFVSSFLSVEFCFIVFSPEWRIDTSTRICRSIILRLWEWPTHFKCTLSGQDSPWHDKDSFGKHIITDVIPYSQYIMSNYGVYYPSAVWILLHYHKREMQRKLNFKIFLCFRAYELLLMNFYQYYMEKKEILYIYCTYCTSIFLHAIKFELLFLEPFYYSFFLLRVVWFFITDHLNITI